MLHIWSPEPEPLAGEGGAPPSRFEVDAPNPLPTRPKDFPAWYGELVRRAGLAENSVVRGAMLIKPYGYAIWEAIQRELDD